MAPSGKKDIPTAKKTEVEERPEETGVVTKDGDAPWRRPVLFGYFVMVLFFGVFGLWAGTAPLGSAVIATGKLRVDSEIKTVESIDGGRVTEIFVREGDVVDAGQLLLRLDPTRVDAEFEVNFASFADDLLQRSRLKAELEGHEKIEVPEQLEPFLSRPDIQDMIDKAQKQLVSNRQRAQRREELMQERILQKHLEIEALRERETSISTQLALIKSELSSVEVMVEKGLERRPRLLSLQRAEANLIGSRGEVRANIAKTEQEISEIELQIIATREAIDNNNSEKLSNTEIRIKTNAEKLNITNDRLKYLEVRAPNSGKIMELNIHTVGDLVGAGEKLMQIVPLDEELIVEANVGQRDIDSVRVGAPVQVRLTAFSARTTPPINGHLVSISGDTTMDPRSGKEVYKALIRIDNKHLDKVLPNTKLQPGMPASAMIAVGQRTLLAYWVTPLTSSIQQSLREP